MSTAAQESVNSTTHIHEIYIKATPAAIWDAVTSPEWTAKYGYRGISEYELKPGGKFRARANEQMRAYGLPEVIVDGEVIEASPPHKLVQTYRFLFNDAHRDEGFSRITWEIVQTEADFCRLTITHEIPAGATMMRGAVTSKFSTQGGGGWNWILSDLKSLLETGKTMS
jgi:uncharacterized protein YndB with AHSA1/START domain